MGDRGARRRSATCAGAVALLAVVTALTAVFSVRPAQSGVMPEGAVSEHRIYWGAYENGSPTYDDLYGGNWPTAPWDCAYGSPRCATQNTFAAHAGKEPDIIHWGMNAPPWVHDFNYWKPGLNLVVRRGDINAVDLSTASVADRDIANGSYDSPILTWMQEAAQWGHPFFLILDVEMNGTWEPYSPGVSGNTASDFVDMWRHIHGLATQAGASNITWVWAPNVDPANLFTPYSQLYPGDGYVDWTGLDGFNKDGNSSFSWLYGSSYAKLLQLAPSKPIMITQVASVESGRAVRAWARTRFPDYRRRPPLRRFRPRARHGKGAWISDMLTAQLPKNFPQIKAFLWFNWRANENGSWVDWEIESSPNAKRAFAAGISSGYYQAGGRFGRLPSLTKIAPLP